MSLTDLFASLPTPAPGDHVPTFSTILIGTWPHRLGRNSDGDPALLIALTEGAGTPIPPPVELRNIQILPQARCRLLRSNAEPETATVMVVRCRGDSTLHEYFLSILDTILPLLGTHPSAQRVQEITAALIELFRSLELPPHDTVQGLWSELFLINQASNPIALLSSWHAQSDDTFDFASSGQRLEVKSTAGLDRRHHFTLVQLTPPAGVVAVIASLFSNTAGGGVSVGDLLDSIARQVAGHPEFVLKLQRVIAASLGDSWLPGLAERFDLDRAQESLRFYEAASIPTIRSGDVPAAVSEVRFVADLTRVTPINETTLGARGDLCAAATPRHNHT